MENSTLSNLALQVKYEIDLCRKDLSNLDSLSSNRELAALINVNYKSYISNVLAIFLSEEDRKYRADLLIRRNASKVGYRTMKDKSGIFKKNKRKSYCQAGGNASFEKSKGIHALSSYKKSICGHVGKIVSMLKKVNAAPYYSFKKV